MNLPSSHLHSRSVLDLSAEHILLELSDLDSVWYHTRLTVMAEHDYLFVPEKYQNLLSGQQAIQKFAYGAQNLTGSAATRIVVVKYWHDEAQILRFGLCRLEWAGRETVGWSEKGLEKSPQLDFITMLFEHSEPLIVG